MITLKEIIKNGGATLNNRGEAAAYKSGFQVSYKDLHVCKVKELRKRELKEIINDLPETSHLGIWIEKGMAYIDLSERISNYKHALKIGRERKQISVWSWRKRAAVYC